MLKKLKKALNSLNNINEVLSCLNELVAIKEKANQTGFENYHHLFSNERDIDALKRTITILTILRTDETESNNATFIFIPENDSITEFGYMTKNQFSNLLKKYCYNKKAINFLADMLES
jgi:hypothetical protein